MSLLHKPIAAVKEADLLWLIQNQVAEDRVIEYKELLPTDSYEHKKDFLAGVCSLANTAGGDLIFGIRTESGVPKEIKGLIVADLDAEKLRLEDLIRSGIHPRCPGVVIHTVPLQKGQSALCVRVPRSSLAPHVVRHQGHWRFYGRNSAGKYPLEVEEVRAAILAGESTAERIRAFRADQLHRILTDQAPVQLFRYPRVVLHLVPVSSVASPGGVDLTWLPNHAHEVAPISRLPTGYWDYRYNLDGFLIYTPGQSGALGYTQVFRSGAVECVDMCPVEGNLLQVTSLERRVIEVMVRLISVQDRLGVAPPVAVLVDVLGVMGNVISVHSLRAGAHPVHGIDRDPVMLPDVLVDDLKVDTAKMAAYLRPVFDALWNAAGWPRSLDYDDRGQWTGGS